MSTASKRASARKTYRTEWVDRWSPPKPLVGLHASAGGVRVGEQPERGAALQLLPGERPEQCGRRHDERQQSADAARVGEHPHDPGDHQGGKQGGRARDHDGGGEAGDGGETQ